jgi:hypothetical protein
VTLPDETNHTGDESRRLTGSGSSPDDEVRVGLEGLKRLEIVFDPWPDATSPDFVGRRLLGGAGCGGTHTERRNSINRREGVEDAL